MICIDYIVCVACVAPMADKGSMTCIACDLWPTKALYGLQIMVFGPMALTVPCIPTGGFSSEDCLESFACRDRCRESCTDRYGESYNYRDSSTERYT